MRVIVLGIHEAETILLVERDCIQIGIDSQETATCLVVDNEHRLDVVQNGRSNPQPLCGFINPQATQLHCGITFQTFFIREAAFFAKTIEFRLVLKISYGNLVIRKAAISVNLTGIIYVNTSIRHGQQMFLKCRCMVKDKIV